LDGFQVRWHPPAPDRAGDNTDPSGLTPTNWSGFCPSCPNSMTQVLRCTRGLIPGLQAKRIHSGLGPDQTGTGKIPG
jgi:hypothetical protein